MVLSRLAIFPVRGPAELSYFIFENTFSLSGRTFTYVVLTITQC